MALLLALFALLLLSAIGLFMVLASNTETRIDANYSSSLRSYYAARSGVEEVRDRMKTLSTSNTIPGGLADLLPQDIAGNAGGVLYVLNPANGETVDPTDSTSPYFDDQLCHDYNSGVCGRRYQMYSASRHRKLGVRFKEFSSFIYAKPNYGNGPYTTGV